MSYNYSLIVIGLLYMANPNGRKFASQPRLKPNPVKEPPTHESMSYLDRMLLHVCALHGTLSAHMTRHTADGALLGKR